MVIIHSIMSKKDFYIGWQPEMADSNSQFLRKRILPIFIGIPILVFLFVFFQKPFNNHLFDFGNISEITGTYYHSPVPMLVADEGELDDNFSNEILLVGFAKFGALGTMQSIQETAGDLNCKKITLAGTLIHGDGKTLMELTQETASLIKVEDATRQPIPKTTNRTPINLKGEILDPKCYFGVMKPAEGKIHKSCAIRCISGGIPPVFRQPTGKADQPYDYFLMMDESGKSINQEVLSFVGEPVSVAGNTTNFLEWKVLYINPDNINILD